MTLKKNGKTETAEYDAPKSNASVDSRIRQLHDERFAEFEQELQNRKNLQERSDAQQKARLTQRRDFMESIGTDVTKLTEAIKKDNHYQEEHLKSFLGEFRSKVAHERPKNPGLAKEVATLREALTETGHTIVPVKASSLIVDDVHLYADLHDLKFTDGSIGGGWVFPDDPSRIHIKDTRHYPNALCWDNRDWGPAIPEFNSYFTFIPSVTATYEMTAVFALHGFYILRCDDSWWNCRNAGVQLKVQMNVNQYAMAGWHDFPIIDESKDNVDEIVSYDRTHFFDYTTGLRAGDPVVVVVKGIVKATAHGGGAYAELNFADGTANYIEPLFVSVQQV